MGRKHSDKVMTTIRVTQEQRAFISTKRHETEPIHITVNRILSQYNGSELEAIHDSYEILNQHSIKQKEKIDLLQKELDQLRVEKGMIRSIQEFI